MSFFFQSWSPPLTGKAHASIQNRFLHFGPQDPTGNRYQDIHCMREALDSRVLSPRRNSSKSYK